MEWQDVLAYLILTIIYVGGVVPMIGSVTQNHSSLYREDWVVGFVIHAVLLGFAAVLSATIWAVFRVI